MYECVCVPFPNTVMVLIYYDYYYSTTLTLVVPRDIQGPRVITAQVNPSLKT